MSEIRMVEVMVRTNFLDNPGLTSYEAQSPGGYHNGTWGVLLIFDSPDARQAWLKGRP